MNEKYRDDYRVLGVRPGCTWGELKLAYRRLVRVWHPDQRQSREDPVADHRIKDINTAFRRLADFYRRHGELPRIPSENAVGEPTSGVHATSPQATAYDRTVQTHAPTRVPGRWRAGARYLLVGAALAIAYAVTVNFFRDEEPDAIRPEYTHRASQPSTTAPKNEPQKRPVTYFMPGSSIGEVISAQGPPTRIEGDTWHYGKSRVHFRNGRVTHWDHDEGSPLNARLVAAAPTPSSAKTFGIGSTKEDVRAAQGPPVIETDMMWDYGASRVHFKDGKVTGWDESPLRPLHVRR